MVVLQVTGGLWMVALMVSLRMLSSPLAQGRETPVLPKVNVFPSNTGSLQHHNLLVCHVTDFYPGSIEIRWFRNGQEETAGIVTADLIRNGDWTFRILVMLEMTPQKGDVYTCHVEHPSLDSPVTVEWDLQIRLQDLRQEPESVAGGSSLTMGLFFPEAQSDSAQSKMLTGVGGFALGLIFLRMSFVGYSLPFCCLTHLLSCNKEAEAEKQNHRAQEATGN